MRDKLLILDFGSQYTQLIARKVRELNIYCEILPYNKGVITEDIKGVIFSGSPFSVTEEKALQVGLDEYLGKVPVLGVCYGAQYLAHKCGGNVERSTKREYGKADLVKLHSDDLFLDGINVPSQVWMSHGDTIMGLPEEAELLASTENVEVAAFKLNGYEKPVYGIQFHPEVFHSTDGIQFIKNFAVDVCGMAQEWTPNAFAETSIKDLKAKLGNDKVVLGLSGGVDSSVAALLLHEAIGANLYCIFIDNGLLRKNEYQDVLDKYEGLGLNIRGIDSSEEFLSELKDITDPEKKRKVIGRVFIEVFEKAANELQDVKWLAQGTIYPDVIESVSVHGPSVTIKSHHNVGGLPEKLNLKIVEPLRSLFKDEVRRVGKTLNLPSEILNRHPFPGPGLAVRILGAITKERVEILQEADHIFINLLKKHNEYDKVWQAGVVLLPIQSVGVMGDERTYENPVALRAVNSTDGMTAEWSKLPYDLLAKVSSEIINNVKGINRVVYDISTKPPSTIEWE